MTVGLSMPVSSAEAQAYRAAGYWASDIPVDVATVAACGARTAIIDRRGAITYAELASATEHVAAVLHGFGVRQGDAVVVVTDNDRESVIACHAAWRLGAVAVLVQKSSGTADVEFACAAASPAVALLAPAAEAHRGAAAAHTRHVHAIGGLADVDGPPAPDVTADPDAARLVLFTSGTTSTPKGVVHTTNTLRASGANFRAMSDLSPDDRFFLVSPLASMAGVLQVLQLAPGLGATAVVENAWNEERTLDFLIDSGGTFYGGTDTVLARLFDAAHRRGVGLPLRGVSVGGTMLRQDVLDDAENSFGILVLRVYGSSEAPNSTGARPHEARDVRMGNDGVPAPGVELRVLDDGTHEVMIRGPHLFRGYLDPADNEGVFDRDWFRTGDAAELVDGRLRVVGRLKEIANRNGRKVSLAEIEESFRAVTPVDDCAAFSVPDAVTGERVVLAVRMSAEHSLDVPAALNAMVAAGLAKWKLPESVVRYESPFPMTATAKVRRRDLSEATGTLIWRAERLARRGR